MELTFALNLLNTIANNKQQEVDAIKLAVSILSDKFQPELTRMQQAEVVVDTQNTQLINKQKEIENAIEIISKVAPEFIDIEGKVKEIDKETKLPINK